MRNHLNRLLCLALLLLSGLTRFSEAGASEPILRIENGAHMAAVRAIAADRDGQTVLTASDDKTARLWHSATGKLLAVLRPSIDTGNVGKLFAAALSPAGDVVAVAGWSADNEIYLFSRNNGALLSRISGLPNVINKLAFSPDGALLAVGLWGNGGIRLYRRVDNWRRFGLAGEEADYGGDAYGVAFSPDGNRLATSSYDGQIRLYSIRAGSLWRLAATRTSLGGKPHGLDFSPDGTRIAVGFADVAGVSVLRADTLALEFSPESRPNDEGGASSVAWSRDGRHLFAAGRLREGVSKYVIRRWPQAGRGTAEDFTVATDSILGLLALPDQTLAFAAADASWGMLRPDGSIRSRSLPPRADLRTDGDGLQLAEDGTAIRFGYEFGGARPAAFDVTNLAWRRTDQTLLTPLRKYPGLRVDAWRDTQAPTLNRRPIPLEPGETSLTMAIAHDGSAIALGTGWYLRLHAPNGREIWKAESPSACFSVNLSKNGRWVVAGFGDGTVRWFQRSNGAEVLAFYPDANGQDWIAWTPDGRYAASSEGDRLVGWHVDRGPDLAAEFLSIGRFAERYHDPAGVAEAIAATPLRKTFADVRQGVSLPPLVSIQLPKATGSAVRDRLQVEVSAHDRGAGIDEFRLSLNGKVVATRAGSRLEGPSRIGKKKPARGGKEIRVRFTIQLEPGRNEIQAVVLGANRVESEPARLVVDAPETPSRPLLHVLAIGVNQYRNSTLNLDYSVPDARGVSGFFKTMPGGLFRDIRVDELFDSQATRNNILASLRNLRESRPEDAVVVYLAGHGETIVDDWFFIPHEVTTPEQPDMLRQGGLSSQDLALELKSIPARKIVIFIDACKSGAAASGFRGLQDRRALAQLSRATGTHLIAATTKDQLASELPTLGHGVFTYTLLQGLKGKASSGGRDVTARKLMVYVEQALPELTKRYRAEEQYPVVNSTGMDFPLVLY